MPIYSPFAIRNHHNNLFYRFPKIDAGGGPETKHFIGVALYHLVLLDLVGIEVYCHSIHHHSGTPLLLCHPGESHHHRCRLPLTLQ